MEPAGGKKAIAATVAHVIVPMNHVTGHKRYVNSIRTGYRGVEKDQIIPVHRSVVGMKPKKKIPFSLVDVIYKYGGGIGPIPPVTPLPLPPQQPRPNY